MSDETNAVIDPFDTPANEVNTDFPRLMPNRNYKMAIRGAELVAGKADATVMSLVFRLETTEDATDTEGNTLYKGFKFIHRINGASGKRTKEAVRDEYVQLIKAIEGKDSKLTPRQVMDNPSIINDKLVNVKVGIQPAKDNYPERNTARFLIPS